MCVNELVMVYAAGVVSCGVDDFLFVAFNRADDNLVVVFGGFVFLFELVCVVVDLLIR